MGFRELEEEYRARREAHKPVNDFLRKASGVAPERQDTRGEQVRDESGQFVSGRGLDGGSRGAQQGMQESDDTSGVVNKWLREKTGLDPGEGM